MSSTNRFYPGYPVVVIDTVANAADANPVVGQCYLIAGRLYEAKLTGTAEAVYNTVIAANNGVLYNETSAQPSTGLAAAAAGTAGTGVTAVETTADGVNFVTTLTLAFNLTIAGAAAEAVGALIYTFPAGRHLHSVTAMDVILTGGGTVDADTPDVGLGSAIGTGAVATLDLVGATAEDYVTGQTATDVSGTAIPAYLPATAGIHTGISLNDTADVKLVHLNVADTWAGADTIAVSGTVAFAWTIV